MHWMRNVRHLGALVLSALTGFALTVDAFAGGSHEARFSMVLIMLNACQVLWIQRLCVFRELALYLVFLAYMLVTLLWTEDVTLGVGTVLIAANFALIVLLLTSLVSYHDLAAVLRGLVLGFLVGACAYAITERFPLVYPEGFSYNAIAGMYLFGLFITAVCGWYLRARVVPIALSVILILHIVATTSIKTNLGLLLGLAIAGLSYFRDSTKLLVRNFALLVVLGGIVAFYVQKNEDLSDRIQRGLARVSVGAQVLAAREDPSGINGLEMREYWKSQGLKGWMGNPIFGYGVEAFRKDYGITSHSTVVDLLYNAGAVGFTLFYGMFASIAWRLYRARSRVRGFRAIAIVGLVCYLFMSLSSTLYYDPLLAAFMAICVGVLTRTAERSSRVAPVAPMEFQPVAAG